MRLRTTKQLSEALRKVEEDARKKILSHFKNTKEKFGVLLIKDTQELNITEGSMKMKIVKMEGDGSFVYKLNNGYGLTGRNTIAILSADSLLTILDELGRMKKAK